MSNWLIVLIVILVISLINTALVLLTDYSKLDETLVMQIMCGIVGWILIFVGFIINKIKNKRQKKRIKQAKEKLIEELKKESMK